MSFERDPAGSEGPASTGSGEPLVQPAEPGERSAGPPPAPPAERLDSHNMLPPRQRRRSRLERLLVRLIATCGIVAIGVAIAAIMVSNKSAGWIVGLVVSIVSVVLAAILWSSRQV
ncbi:MAG TPA: hypothetical protein VG325_05905 [Solirubrobacteraceae bacterium]|jgi:hypothetical protein|nr:hypothetical protein [Solirubrobacteraceae bacterium]